MVRDSQDRRAEFPSPKDQGIDGDTDEALMQAYQQGNDRAFEVLYRRHSGRIYGYLKAKVRDRAFADDLVQATFLKVHSARGHYDSSFPFVPWLFTVCRSAMVDGLRTRRKAREDLDQVAVENAVAQAQPVLPEDITELPYDQRTAIEMRYGQDLSFEEIAKRLETSPSNARQLVSRAVRKLRELMGVTGRES